MHIPHMHGMTLPLHAIAIIYAVSRMTLNEFLPILNSRIHSQIAHGIAMCG